jgi:hypothetical protein
MAALATLGLVSNIIQVVSSSWELIKMVQQIRNRGSTAEHEDFEHAATELEKASSELETSVRSHASGDADLNELAKGTLKVAKDLQTSLNKCKVGGKGRFLKIGIKVVYTFWYSGEILAAEKKLRKYRDSLQTRILVRISCLEDARYGWIAESLEKIMGASLSEQAGQRC